MGQISMKIICLPGSLLSANQHFQLTYVSKALLLEQEKNVFAPLPTGPSAGAIATAQPAKRRAKTARRG